MRPDAEEILRLVLARLDDMKAEDTLTIDLRGKSSIGDYMVVSSGRSQRHVGSVADRVIEDLHKAGVAARVEGVPHCDWVLIDAGDVLIHNSSLHGTPHLPEFCMVKPMFRDGEVVAVLATIAHHADVGGMAPGGMPGDSTDIHQEGVIIPPVKLFRKGAAVDEIWRILLSNTRTAASSSSVRRTLPRRGSAT
jgi:ribosome silencing factor RsfS/YbeB/iojap